MEETPEFVEAKKEMLRNIAKDLKVRTKSHSSTRAEGAMKEVTQHKKVRLLNSKGDELAEVDLISKYSVSSKKKDKKDEDLDKVLAEAEAFLDDNGEKEASSVD